MDRKLAVKASLDTRSGSRQTRITIVLGAASGYAVAFLLIVPTVGAQASALAVIPVVTAAWLFGLRAGLLAALLSLPVNLLLFVLLGRPVAGWSGLPLGGLGLGTALLLVAGAAVGRLRDLSERSERELAERQRAEQELRANEERFRQLAENIHQVFWVVSPERDQTLYVSPAYEDIWGRTCQSLYEEPLSFLDTIHPEDRKSVTNAFEKLMRGQPTFTEYRILRADGSLGWIWSREFPVRNELGQVYRVVGIAEDATERRQAEEELRRTLQKEKELGELKSRFISLVSHEFRTPLSAILSSVELLEHYRHKLTEEKKLDYLHHIQAAVDTMTRLLDDVLIIGRSETGRLKFKPAPLDLAQLCRDLMEEARLGAGPLHTIDFAIQGQCADAQMDKQLLRHILSNLLSNAIKYSPYGGTVRFELRCADGAAIFKIEDEGIGIPPAEQARLFDTFHRATNVGNIPGSGLGLSIAKRLADLHGGTIDFISAVNAGTTFTVSLPLNPPAQEANNDDDSRD